MECYKKQADEARLKAEKDKTKRISLEMMLKKEVEPEADEKTKAIMFVQETETHEKEEEVLMKRLATA